MNLVSEALKISLIIPVYNAEDFIEEAVESAVFFEEIGEIILVEDNSLDNSFKVCEKLVSKYEKVSVHQHNGKVNKGESASRNLGIKKANFEIITFLDADDWYLPNRFLKDLEIFSYNPNVKIIYSFSTINYPNGKVIPYGTQENILNNDKLTEGSVIDFYKYVLENEIILGHVNSNSLRKEVFENGDFFDERLKVHADTEFWLRINRKYLFHAGELKNPVSVARRHDHNTIYSRSRSSETILQLVFIDNIGLKNLYDFEKKYIIYHLARAISNPIKIKFLRKIVLHGFQLVFLPIRSAYIFLFYHWGIRKYRLKK